LIQIKAARAKRRTMAVMGCRHPAVLDPVAANHSRRTL
jgi:hypothetical protein